MLQQHTLQKKHNYMQFAFWQLQYKDNISSPHKTGKEASINFEYIYLINSLS